jgi:flagella basal body P-ring formation protein FlgA
MYKYIFPLLLFTSYVAAEDIQILVLNRDIRRDELITENDLGVEIIDRKSNRGYIEKLGDRPVKALSNLKSGQRIKRADIAIDRFLVHKGETVTVNFMKKNLVIETQALAIGNGAIGDTVKVKNLDTNKIMIGKVSGDRVVTISQ